MELQNDSALLAHHRLQLVTNHVLVELRHIKLLVPHLVKLAFTDELRQLNVSEAFELVVFGELRLKQGAEGGLAYTWGTCHEKVRQ